MLTVAAALHRRAITSASARRRSPRRVPQADPPTTHVREYTRQLRAIVDELDAATLDALASAGVRLDAARSDAAADGSGFLASDAARVAARLREAASKIVLSPRLVRAVDGVADAVVGFTRVQFARQLKAALGVDLTTDPVLTTQRAEFQRENLALIRSLTAEHVDRVARALREGVGERVETLRDRIMAQTSAVRSRASLIARDQVLKLNANVSHARHQAAGITEYIWRTSRDERVRETHRDLDGQRFRYDTPPIVDPKRGRRENPGGDYSCRCTAEPVIPDFSL